MSLPAIDTWQEKATWFFAEPGRMAAFLGCLLLPLLYYGFAMALTRRRRRKVPLAVFTPPRNLPPAALRYLMLRETDARGLIVSLVNAAVKKCYYIRWFRSGFIALREPFGDFDELNEAERQALSFAPNRYWEKVVVSRTTSVRTRKMQQRLAHYLRRRYRRYFQPHTLLIAGGIAVSALAFFGCLAVFCTGNMINMAAVLVLLTVFFIFLPLFFVSVSVQDRYWFGLVFSLLMLGAGIAGILAVENSPGVPLFSLFVIPLSLIHLFFMRMLPTWSEEGHRLRAEILAYREYLNRKVLALRESGGSLRIMEQELPYIMALDLDKSFGPYFRHLLSQTQYGPFRTLETVMGQV